MSSPDTASQEFSNMTAANISVPPLRTRRLEAVWLTAAGAVFAISVLVYWWFTRTSPGMWTHTDEFIYREAGQLVRKHPADLYNVGLGVRGAKPLPFTYPPFAAAVFAVFSTLSFATWQVVLVVVNLILLPVIGYLTLRLAGHRGMMAAAGATVLAAVAIWLQPVYMDLYFGQINLILLVLIIGDLALPDTSRWKGVGIGIAAGIKLTPLIFVPYLLASRRIRAGLVSLATFAVTVLIGFAVLPHASGEYWGGKFATPGDSPAWQENQSIYGMLLRTLQSSWHPRAIWLAAAVIVGLAGLTAAVVASRRRLELLGICLCALTGLLISEISWGHHWVWVMVILALTASLRPRVAAAASTAAIAGVFFAWSIIGQIRPLAPRSFRWAIPDIRGLPAFQNSWLIHSAFTVAGMISLAAAIGYLWFTRGRPSPGSGEITAEGRVPAGEAA